MYQEKIEAIENKITQLEKERELLLKEWAEKHHPLKIGKVIKKNGDVGIKRDEWSCPVEGEDKI